jgi:hypothetical protein
MFIRDLSAFISGSVNVRLQNVFCWPAPASEVASPSERFTLCDFSV